MASRYGLQIRAATPADAAGIAALMDSVGCNLRATTWATRIEAATRDHGTVLLALEWGPPSGLIVLNWHRTLLADDAVAQISTLLVAPAERRRGVARLLLKAGAQAARLAGCGSLHLFTTETDVTLPAFARASGFDPEAKVLTRALRKASK